ncbi:MAG: hypothetical protein KY462_15310 [Actinobacteria bacterium]|nr:hypothetical protein [Actinomycetota bacterium]
MGLRAPRTISASPCRRAFSAVTIGGYRNEEQKRHFFGEVLPDLVRREGSDGVLVVAEATRGGDDVLLVPAEQRDGQQAALLTPFAKKFPRRIIFEKRPTRVASRLICSMTSALSGLRVSS